MVSELKSILFRLSWSRPILMHLFAKLASTRRKSGRRVLMHISLSDYEERRDNKRTKMRHDCPSKTLQSIGIDLINCKISLFITVLCIKNNLSAYIK